MKKRFSIVSFTRYLFFIALILFGSLPSSASAMDIPFFQSNDILYYDGSSGTGCNTVGANYSTNLDLPGLSGGDNAEKVWNFLTGQEGGLSPEQAAGIMGNIKQESNFEPDVEEGADSAARHTVRPVGYGIVQWTGGRRLALEAAAETKGVPASDLGFQLAFMVQESKDRQVDSWVIAREEEADFGASGDNEWETLKKQNTAADAAAFWHAAFERSGDTRSQIQERIDDAEAFLQQFGGRAAGGSSSGSGCSASAAGSGDLTALLLEYAHPEFHENNWDGPVPPPKPAYLEAATKLSNEGKWVGGGQMEIGIPGIDCGGFVSILLTQSGMEPDYNFGLDMDRGSSNQEYGQLPWAMRNWSFLGTGGSINTSDLQPGDVAYSQGHTFIFVGEIEGFSSQYASASYSWWRAPMAAGSWDGGFESATNPDYVWYGRRPENGTPPAYGSTTMGDVPSQQSPYYQPGDKF